MGYIDRYINSVFRLYRREVGPCGARLRGLCTNEAPFSSTFRCHPAFRVDVSERAGTDTEFWGIQKIIYCSYIGVSVCVTATRCLRHAMLTDMIHLGKWSVYEAREWDVNSSRQKCTHNNCDRK